MVVLTFHWLVGHHCSTQYVVVPAFSEQILTNCEGVGVIMAHQQSSEGLRFKVPMVPLIPALSIAANIGLMVNLNPMTWVRFGVWMAVGKKSVVQ